MLKDFFTEDKSILDKSIGLLVNGVEIYSPSLFDESVYYGELSNIEVLNSGEDYDLLNPPTVFVEDENGLGAEVIGNLKGTIKEILVLSPGIGYSKKPNLSLIGGNPDDGIELETNLIKKALIAQFIPNESNVLSATKTIKFISNHNFEDTEEIIYSSNNLTPINGIINGSNYFVGIVAPDEIKIYNTKEDAISQTNAVQVSVTVGIQSGLHEFRTKSIKNVIDKVYIKSSSGYFYNRSIKIPSSLVTPTNLTNGISITDNCVYAKNHNFREKDLILYTTTGNVIAGLSTSSKYYVSIVDENKFKLCDAGLNDIPDLTDYNNKTFVNLSSIGSGFHNFKYVPIEIKVTTTTGITSTRPPILEPVIAGEFENIFISNYGSNYGCNDIVDYHRRPTIKVGTELVDQDGFITEAVLNPIIVDNKIVDVQILNPGDNYENDNEIVISGSGRYAQLYPIIENGKLVDVSILSTGSGYEAGKTLLTLRKKGKGAKFLANITKWTVDQYKKNEDFISTNTGEGITIPSRNNKNSLQFINFHPPKELLDEILDDGTKTSGIVGWAYDGNPIYGPYIENNGVVGLVTSGYSLRNDIFSLISSKKRPDFPEQSFIEDYEYIQGNSNLDENNSRFLPPSNEFPKGTNAYYYTARKEGNTLKPVFPYIIGKEFKTTPVDKNFLNTFNQDIDFNLKNYIKNTSPLFLISDNSGYDYIKTVDAKYKQEFEVKKTLTSGIDGIKIIQPGTGYKVNDRLIFDKENSSSNPPNCYVYRLEGKSISQFEVGITTLSNIKFKSSLNSVIGISTLPNGILDNSYISITTITNPDFNYLLGSKLVRVQNKVVGLGENIPSSTGISTYIQVNDINGFEVDDYIKVDNEVFKVTDISSLENKLYVDRARLSTSQGIHTAGISSVNLLPTKFEFLEPSLDKNIKVSSQTYFNPSISVGLGTTGSSYKVGVQKEYFVPSQEIYIKNHGYKTNDALIYRVGTSGNGLVVSNTGAGTTSILVNNQTVYAINFGDDYLGISTVGYSTGALYFRSNDISLGQSHSFELVQNNLTGTVEIGTILISTDVNHELEDADSVRFYALENTNEYTVINNDYNYEYPIKKVGITTFIINLPKIITSTPVNLNNVKYHTNSKNATGGINKIKINYPGSSYSKLPILKGITSLNGRGSVLIPQSNKIGKVDLLDIIKSGFDYPSDLTVTPKLSTTTIAYLDNISKISKVNVINKGRNYNVPPTLKVKGNTDIFLSAVLYNSSVSDVIISNNSNNLSVPLEIIPVNNSNGYNILNITVNGNEIIVTLDTTTFPLIYRDYSDPIVDFPFDVNDLVFIENCVVFNGDTFNSENYNDKYFRVVDVNSTNNTITYDASGITANFGVYDPDTSGVYGIIVNKKDIPSFEMILEKNSYLPNEVVNSFDVDGNLKFYGEVMEDNGWNLESSQIRIKNSKGILNVNDKLYGNKSLLEGVILEVNNFNLKAKLNSTKDKINYSEKDIGDLNNSLKRLQDSDYYQNFSYSIVSTTPYSVWKEPVKSIVHPSGYKEFSDLQVVSKSTNNAKVKTIGSNVNFILKLDNEKSFSTVDNFAVAYELFSNSENASKIEKIYFGSGGANWPVAGVESPIPVNGINILPYILNKTNNVIRLQDVSNQFTGSSDYINVKSENVTFNSQIPYYLGVSTSGLQVGDIIGYSTYHAYPNNTIIKSVGINSVELWSPHTLYSGTVVENLEFTRKLNNNQAVGISSFILKSNEGLDVFSLNVDPLSISSNKVNFRNYFQKGQKIFYENIGGSPIGIVTTNQVEGGISTDIIPTTLYISNSNLTSFDVSGLSTSSKLEFSSIGSGIHKFTFENPNKNSIITIDNIVQAPVYIKNLELGLTNSINIGDTSIYLSSGISSITSSDILKINQEYFKITNIGIGSTNSVDVERAFIGSTEDNHDVSSVVKVYGGNYNIVDNFIYFTSPPYGPTGLSGMKVNSQFSGRVFTRAFNSSKPNDKNFIFDDISDKFTGLDTFTLKENGNTLVGIYTNTNSSVNINNNPIILINNVIQVPGYSFDIQNINANEIYFPNEVPKSGKILKIGITTGEGYMPLVGASATFSVSPSGNISNVYLTGAGSGYREVPNINIISNTGVGASITATIGAGGTISSLTIINPGVGYTSTENNFVDIDEPLPYSRINLEYNSGSGIGTGAQITISVGSTGNILNYELNTYGKNYKVGDVLSPVGIITDSNYSGTFKEFKVIVDEVFSDQFSGVYLGQFIIFEDISSQFNSIRKSFDLSTVIDGVSRKITLKLDSNDSNRNIENNFIILINDVIQEPRVSYIYSGDRIVFREAPKTGSSCTILFYRGSSIDVEEITPLPNIKEGDIVKFEDSELSQLDNDQLPRVVKRLVSSSSLETFTYSGYGIINLIPRPISWDRQKTDRIISGSLISKSRPSMKSKLYPNAKLIKNVSPSDTSIYVDNAYPIFTNIDNILEEKNNVRIVNDSNEFIDAILTSSVSVGSSISSITIIEPGSGYSVLNPVISIGNSSRIEKDPLYDWRYISGISTTSAFNSIYQDNLNIVAVGESNFIGISTNLFDWISEDTSYLSSSDLTDIISNNGIYISVGSNGSIFIKDESNIWTKANLQIEVIPPFGEIIIEPSNYSSTFNDVIYNEYLGTYFAVGDDGGIYYSKNISTGAFTSSSLVTTIDYKSIAYNSNITVIVGHSGIIASTNGNIWNSAFGTSGNYNDVIWDVDRFIAVSDTGIYTSTNGLGWQNINNFITTLNKIKHYGNIYIGLSTSGETSYSFDLINWENKDNQTLETLTDFSQIVINDSIYYSFVGTAGTITYTIPTYNYAVVESSTTSGSISSVTIINGGFGYSSENPPVVLLESPKVTCEDIFTIKAVGDFGTIVGVNTFPVGTPGIGTTTPKLEFELKTNYYDNDNLGIGYSSLNTFGINYSQLSVGDYFIINNSNVACGHALTGITTSLGAMANYPASKVGTATTFLDGVYRVESVVSTNTVAGIVTVGCNFVPVNNGLNINVSGLNTDYYGNYSWSKIYDYENRSIRTPRSFNVDTDNGLIGLSTSPTVYRKTPLIF